MLKNQIDDNRLYRTLDWLLPRKVQLEGSPEKPHGRAELFDLEYDLLMYGVTSTYLNSVEIPRLINMITAWTSLQKIWCYGS